jgi:hypothetical protein
MVRGRETGDKFFGPTTKTFSVISHRTYAKTDNAVGYAHFQRAAWWFPGAIRAHESTLEACVPSFL